MTTPSSSATGRVSSTSPARGHGPRRPSHGCRCKDTRVVPRHSSWGVTGTGGSSGGLGDGPGRHPPSLCKVRTSRSRPLRPLSLPRPLPPPPCFNLSPSGTHFLRSVYDSFLARRSSALRGDESKLHPGSLGNRPLNSCVHRGWGLPSALHECSTTPDRSPLSASDARGCHTPPRRSEAGSGRGGGAGGPGGSDRGGEVSGVGGSDGGDLRSGHERREEQPHPLL